MQDVHDEEDRQSHQHEEWDVEVTGEEQQRQGECCEGDAAARSILERVEDPGKTPWDPSQADG